MERIVYRPIGPLNPDGKILVFPNAIDSFYKRLEAKPGERQQALVLASFEINEEKTDWEYPTLDDLLPIVYSDRYYPQGTTYLVREANNSARAFAKSLEAKKKQAVKIADKVREQRESYSNLTNGEILNVVFRDISFEEFALKTRIREE